MIRNRLVVVGVSAAVLVTGSPALPAVATAKPRPRPAASGPGEGWTERSHWVRNADGTVTAQLYATPAFRHTGGTWAPIDTTVRTRKDTAFPYEAAGLTRRVRFGTRRQALASIDLDGGSVVVSAPSLRIGRPAFASGRLTYRDVATAADLRTYPTAAGLEQEVVLRSAAAPREYTFHLSDPHRILGTPRALPDGGVRFSAPVVDGHGLEVAAPVAYAADGKGRTDRPSATITVRAAGDGYDVVERVDETWLRGRTYPVVLDPTFSLTGPVTTTDCGIDASTAHQFVAQCDQGDVKAGVAPGAKLLPIEPDQWVKHRYLVRFDLTALPPGAQVVPGGSTVVLDVAGSNGPGSLSLQSPAQPWTTAATWWTANGSTLWTTAGGSPEGVTYASKSIPANMYGPLTFGPTGGLDGILAYWIAHPTENRGFMAMGADESTGTWALIAATHNASRTKPVLNVTFTAPPTAPATATASPRDGAAQVTWTAPTDYGSPILDHTVAAVRASDNAVLGSHVVTGATASSHLFTGLTNGVPVYFRVSARNAIGTGPVRTTGTVTPLPAPGPPVSVTADRGDGQVTVHWQPAAGGQAATGFTVRLYQGSTLVASTNAPASSTSAGLGGLTNGTAYVATVTADNLYGSSTPVAAPSFVPAGLPGSPAPAAISTADGPITVSWQAAAGNGEPVTGYVVDLHRVSSGTSTTVRVGPAQRSVELSGSPGYEYYATVHAQNAVGDGPDATSASVVATGVPGAPTGFGVVPGDRSAIASWTAPADAGTPLTGYRLVATLASDGSVAASADVPPGTTVYTLTGLANGVAYRAEIAALNDVGRGATARSGSFTPVEPAPADQLGAVGTVAGSTDSVTRAGVGSGAAFRGARSVTTDGTTAYVGTDEAIQEVNLATGEVTVLAGTPDSNEACVDAASGDGVQFEPIKDVAVDAGYVYSLSTCGLRRTDRETGATELVTDEVPWYSRSMVVGPDGKVYVIANTPVYQVDPATGETTVLDYFGMALSVAADADYLYVAGTNYVARRAWDTGEITYVAENDTRINGAAVATSGAYVYTLDNQNRVIRVRKSDGAVTYVAGSASYGHNDGIGTDAWFIAPVDLAMAGTDLLVADADWGYAPVHGHYLRRVTSAAPLPSRQPAGFSAARTLADAHAVLLTALDDDPIWPRAVAVNGRYVYLGRTASVDRYDMQTGELVRWLGTGDWSTGVVASLDPAQVNVGLPTGLTTDGYYLYIADQGRLRRVSLATGATSVITTASSSFGSVAMGPDGYLYVGTSTGDSRVYRIDPKTGETTTVGGVGATTMDTAVAADATTAYASVSDWYCGGSPTLQRIDVATGEAVSTSTSPQLGTSIVSAGRYLYGVMPHESSYGFCPERQIDFQTVTRLDKTTGEVATVAYLPPPLSTNPASTAVTADGDVLYVLRGDGLYLVANDDFFAPDGAAFGADGYSAWQDNVNAGIGNFVWPEQDAAVSTYGPALAMSRTYNSRDPRAGGLGRGWSDDHEMTWQADQKGSVTVLYGDGRRETHRKRDDGTFAPPSGQAAHLAASGGGYTLTQRDGTVYLLDDQHRLTQRRDANGNALTYSYDGGGRLQTVTSASGRALHVTWSGGHIATVSTDPVGGTPRTWTYTYDGDLLTKVCTPRGTGADHCTRYAYSGGLLTQVTRARGNVVANVGYLPSGQVQYREDGLGNFTEYAYDGKTVYVTDARHDTTKQVYDAESRLTSETNPYGKTKTYTYDANGFRNSVTDENGIVTRTTFDANGNPTVDEDGLGKKTYMSYDASDNLTAKRDQRSANAADNTYRTTYAYDAYRNRLSITTPATAQFPSGVTTAWTYTTGSEAAYGGTGTMPPRLLRTAADGRGNVITYSYYANGDIGREVDRLGKVTTYTYDALGRELTKTEVTTAFAALTTTYTYDEAGNVLTETSPAVLNRVANVTHRLRVTTSYDANGNVESVRQEDLDGGDAARLTTYGYDGLDRQVRSTDNETGQSLTRTYDAAGNVAVVTDQLGRETVTTYDKANRAVMTYQRSFVDDPVSPGTPRDLVVRRLTFDPGGRPLTETDGVGHTRRWTYDDAGRVTKVTLLGYHDRNGTTRDVVVDERAYDAAGNLTTLKSGNGAKVETRTWDAAGRNTAGTLRLDATHLRTTTMTYDADGHPTLVSKTDGTRTDVSAYTYDAAGNVTSEAVRNGAAVFTKRLKRYDDRGLLVEEVDPRGVADPAHESDFTTTYQYDEAGRRYRTLLPPVAVDDGTTSATARPELLDGHDTFGNATHHRDARLAVTVTDYDRLNRRTVVHHPSYTPPGGSVVNPTESWTYDNVGNVLSATDRRGRTTDFTYDARNRVVRQSDPLVAGATARGTVRYTYDDVGQRVSTVDQRGARTTATYDDLGRPRTKTAVVHVEGAGVESDTTTYDYDDLGDVTYTRGAAGDETVHTYSPAGERLTTVDPASRTWTYTYDVGGRQLSAEDPLHRVTRTTYDPAGRPTQVDRYGPGGTGTPLTGTMRYDAAGNVLGQSTPRGVAGSYETTFTVDALGRTTDVHQPVAAGTETVTHYGYDAAGNVTRLVDGRGNTTVYGYNAWSLRTSVTEPSVGGAAGTWTTVYDAGGLPVEDRQPGGVTVARTFDALGRMTNESGSGSGVTAASRQVAYDLGGVPTSVSHPSGTETFHHDDRRLLTSASGPAGAAAFGYDAAGRMVRRTDAAGTSTFGWTARNELASATDGLTGAQRTYHWSDAGQLGSVDVGGSSPAVRTYGYDGYGRLTSDVLVDSAGTTQASTSYGYDGDGDLTSRTVTYAAVNPAEGTYAYGYDRSGRLTSMTAPGAAAVTVAWDAAGNRTDAGSDHFTYDARNRLSSGPDGTYTYTDRGTLAAVSGPGGTTSYTFDALGRMTARGSDTYSYDGLDRLVARDGVALTYAGPALDPVAFGANRYARSPGGELLATANATTARLAGLDRHGDLAYSNGATGVIDTTRVYDPFGTTLGTSGSFDVGLGFQGDLTDATSGQVWMGARWYDPDTAGFTSRDSVSGTLRTPISLNRYTYAAGNPLAYFDPDGHRPVEDDGGPTPEQAAVMHRADAARERSIERQARVWGVDPGAYRWAPSRGPGSLSSAVTQARIRMRYGDGWAEGFEEHWGIGDLTHIVKSAGKNLVNLPTAIGNGARNFVVHTANTVVDGYRDIYNLGVYLKTGKIQYAHTDVGKYVPKAKYAFNDRESRYYTKFMEDRTENAIQVYYAVKGAASLYRGGMNVLASLRGAGALAADAETGAAGLTRLGADTAELQGAGRSVGAAHVSDPAFGGDTTALLEETAAGKGNITSQFTVSADEALSAGEEFLGEGYTEAGKPGSGVFRSSDLLRRFRIDATSLEGAHSPYDPHVHFEIFESPGARRPIVNNHVRFYDD